MGRIGELVGASVVVVSVVIILRALFDIPNVGMPVEIKTLLIGVVLLLVVVVGFAVKDPFNGF